MIGDTQQLRIITTPSKHVVMLKGGIGVALPWGAGIEFYTAIKRLSVFSRAYAKHKLHEFVQTEMETVDKITIYRTGLLFLFELNGFKWFDCPWQAARQIAVAVYRKAREIEEVEKHTQLIEDSAILLRSGLPIGLTDNKLIQKEAWKAAADVKFPGCVEPTAIIGAPRIIQHPPRSDAAI